MNKEMHIHSSSPDSCTFPQLEEGAAIKIQAGFRGYRVRKQLNQQARSSLNGHRHFRRSDSYRRRHNLRQQMDTNNSESLETCRPPMGHQTMSDVQSQGEHMGLSLEDRCATKIQAGVRGFLVRKKQKNALDSQLEDNRSDLHLLTVGNKKQEDDNMESSVEDLSAAKIQAGVRDYLFSESSLESYRSGIKQPTSGIMEHKDKHMDLTLEDRSATKIQAGVRGFLVRKEQKRVSDAATKIQAGYRGFKARRETEKLRQQ